MGKYFALLDFLKYEVKKTSKLHIDISIKRYKCIKSFIHKDMIFKT